MTYEIFGGDNGNYKITEAGKVAPIAFVRRNQEGGGYTVEAADKSVSVQMQNMPATQTSEQQADEIMDLLKSDTETTNKVTLAGFWPAHMDRIEARICNKLISTIFDAGYSIQVNCGEVGDVFVPTTQSRQLVQADTAATGMTIYCVMDTSPQHTNPGKAVKVGHVLLVHGNGTEIISDMSWPGSKPENEEIMETLTRPASDLAETL